MFRKIYNESLSTPLFICYKVLFYSFDFNVSDIGIFALISLVALASTRT